MKKIFATLVGALLAVGVAQADTHYWISPNGNNSFNGKSPATAWRTIGQANTAQLAIPNTANGNVIIHLLPRTDQSAWDAMFVPLNDGVNGKYTEIVGDSTVTGPPQNLSALTQYKMPAPYPTIVSSNPDGFHRRDVIFKGIRFTGNLQIGSQGNGDAHGTRVWDCLIEGRLFLSQCVDVAVRRTLVYGDRVLTDSYRKHVGWPAPQPMRRDTIESCRMPNLGIQNDENGWQMDGMDSSLIAFNWARFAALGSSMQTFSAFESRWITMRGNRFNVFWGSSNEPGGKIRNLCIKWAWTNDTLIAVGAGGVGFKFNIGERGGCHWGCGPDGICGNADDVGDGAPFNNHESGCDTSGATRGTTVDSCFFYNATGGPGLNLQLSPDSLRFSYNVFASNGGYAFNYDSDAQKDKLIRWNTWDHNTFTSKGDDGVVNFQGVAPMIATGWSPAGAAQWQVSNNIFNATSLTMIHECNYGASYWTPGVSMRFNDPWPDTASTTFYRNLHSLHGYITTPGDRVYGWQQNGHFCCGVTLNSQAANGFPMKDSLSAYGESDIMNPTVDGVLDANDRPVSFDPRITVISAAKGIGAGGTDAGAIAFVSKPKLRIDQADTTKSGAQDGASGTMTFKFSNIGNDTLYFDTLYVRTSSGAWDKNGGMGNFVYNGATQTKIPTRQPLQFSIAYTNPVQSVPRTVNVAAGSSGYYVLLGSDSVFTTAIDSINATPYTANPPDFGLRRLLFVVMSDAPAESLYLMTFGGTACTKLARYKDTTAGAAVEFWLSPDLPVAAHPSLVTKYTGKTQVTIEDIPLSGVRASSQFRSGGFAADSSAVHSATTAATTAGDLVVAVDAAILAKLATADAPLAGIGGLFGRIGDSGARAYSIAATPGTGSTIPFSFTASSAGNRLTAWVVLRGGMARVAPLVDGLVFDTNDPAYDNTADPTSSPSNVGPGIGFNFNWPWAP